MHLRTLLAVVLVIAAVGTVAAQGETAYTPPGDRALDGLVDGYNANVDQVPGWLEAAVDADVVYVTIYPDAAHIPSDLFAVGAAASAPTIYRFEMGPAGTIQGYAQVETLERGAGVYVVATDADTMDAVLLADDPVRAGTAAFTDGTLRLQASGMVQNAVIRVVRMAAQVRGLLG